MIDMIRRAKQHPAGTVDVVVIGAGQSGLAMSHCLAAHSIDHVILERGEVANSWRRERWDSLRLLTPNWLSRLPGYAYAGDDPDGFMTMNEVVDFVSAYASQSAAPVMTQTAVTGVHASDGAYRVVTNRGEWRCRAVVIASGAFNKASVPAVSAAIPDNIAQLAAFDYKRPDQLADGGVLVVGGSATGLQLANEIHRSGRPVTLAVGEHVRMPRMYRGRDIQWWMLASGVLDQCIDEVDDIVRARRVPSPQLVGTTDHATLDLNALTAIGVQLVGRLAGVRDGKAQFSGSLRNVCALADLKMNRLLGTIDEWANANGLDSEVGPIRRYEPTIVDQAPLGLNLTTGAIHTIVWATGYRPDYSWLDVPVLDRKGQIRHDRGVVDAPGMYLMGLPFLRRRKSSFIHGAEDDARDLSTHLARYLDRIAGERITRLAV
jgi:putative flavoprotein involved in K+ transport